MPLTLAAQRSVAELRGILDQAGGQTPASDVSLVARIRAINVGKGWIALEDASGAEILEISLADPAWEKLRVGQLLGLEFEDCRFVRGEQVIHAGTGPVVQMDGWHTPREKTGSIRLSKGFHPLRIEWFNSLRPPMLQVRLAGQGIEMAEIPEAMLWHFPGAKASPEPGLNFEAYQIPGVAALSDLQGRAPSTSGIARTIGLEHAAGETDVALVFDGLLAVPADGEYSIAVRSVDGAEVRVGGNSPDFQILPGPEPHAAGKPSGMEWKTSSGKVTYSARDGAVLRVVLDSGALRTEVAILDPAGLDVASLQGRSLTASGVGNGEGIRVLGAADVQSSELDPVDRKRLSMAREVRELSPEGSAAGIPVALQGVVTMANYRSLVIQDDSGGVFVLYEGNGSATMPRPGEIWSIQGVTARGDFSPIVVAKDARLVRRGIFPPPQRPNWEQLLNGSLDAEWVEIEGVITSAEQGKVELLTRDGFISIQERVFYPLSRELQDEPSRARLIGSRVRFRGVFATSWDTARARLQPGIVHLGNATMAIDQPGPQSPEDVPLVQIQDLWGFTSKSTALNRVRLRLQMRARSGDRYLMADGPSILSLISEKPFDMVPGDWVEVIGFPRVGPISPFLLHPVVAWIERGVMPAPVLVNGSHLPNAELDGQVVEMDAIVLSDARRQAERVLELRAGNERFSALLGMPHGTGNLLESDTLVRIRGVYVAGRSTGRASVENSFELQLAGAADLTVLRAPPWWTVRRLVLLVSALLGGLVLVLVWVMLLRRQVAQRTSLLAIEIHEKEHAESDRLLEEERARVARDLHDELGAGLTEIGMLSSLLKHPEVPEDARGRYIDTLEEVSGSLVSGLDEIVWAVNPQYDSIQDSASYLWLHSQRMLNPAGIEVRFAQGADIPSRSFGSRRRHSLFLAFKEALNNVVRHSHAEVVNFSIGVENEAVVVVIADDGVGFDPSSAQVVGSDGLAGMRERMRKFGGDCEIESQAGHGTTVRLILPLRVS